MGIWTERVVPHLTDRALSTPEVMSLRQQACAGLRGRVLEIGFGSGLNATLYPTDVERVDAVEPSDVGWRLSERRRSEASTPIERTGVDGQRLSASDAQYDAVLSTFTLCTIPDAARALAEVRRVLAPGGAFHFLEHGRSPDRGVERWQRRLDPLQRRICGGCHLSRDIRALVLASEMEITDLSAAYLPGPKPWAYVFRGRAVGSSS